MGCNGERWSDIPAASVTENWNYPRGKTHNHGWARPWIRCRRWLRIKCTQDNNKKRYRKKKDLNRCQALWGPAIYKAKASPLGLSKAESMRKNMPQMSAVSDGGRYHCADVILRRNTRECKPWGEKTENTGPVLYRGPPATWSTVKAIKSAGQTCVLKLPGKGTRCSHSRSSPGGSEGLTSTVHWITGTAQVTCWELSTEWGCHTWPHPVEWGQGRRLEATFETGTGATQPEILSVSPEVACPTLPPALYQLQPN